jgi:osmoprotectant transport system permease protein
VTDVVDVAWIGRNLDTIAELARQHLTFTVLAVSLGLVIAFPLALLSARRPRLYGPLVAVTGVLFTIPSIALLVLFLPFLGLSDTNVVAMLVVYTLLILLRNTTEGLLAVPRDVREAADAMGYSAARRLWRVELPLALPVVLAGVRLATVTTVGLVTVAFLLGRGGLGQLFLTGYQRDFATPVLVGVVGSVVLAFTLDGLLLLLQRALTPWSRAR